MRSRKLRPKPVMPPGPPRSASATPTLDPDAAGAPDPEQSEPATAPMKTSGFQQMGSAIGGIIAGIENQVFGRPPPGPVLVRHATPSGGKGPDGTEFMLDFPDEPPPAARKTRTAPKAPK